MADEATYDAVTGESNMALIQHVRDTYPMFETNAIRQDIKQFSKKIEAHEDAIEELNKQKEEYKGLLRMIRERDKFMEENNLAIEDGRIVGV